MVTDDVFLKRAVYAAEPDWLFRKFLCTLRNPAYHNNTKELIRSSTKDKRDKMIKFLKVENNVKPIIFNDMKYSKALHENNMFMFLDDDLQVIGFLKGNEWNEKWRDYEAYSAGNNNYTFEVIKNRKNMTEKAAYILMFTPEMMKNKGYSIKTSNRKSNQHAEDLKRRLEKYKKNKHSDITYNQVIDLSKNILIKLANAIGTDEEHEIVKRFREVYSFSDNISDVIRKVSEVMKDYRYYYENNERQIAHYSKRLSAEELKDISSYLSYDPSPYKISLIDYSKIIIGGNQ